MIEKTEEVTTDNEQVNPAPAVETPASVDTPIVEAAPVESHTEKQDAKMTAAFIAQRHKYTSRIKELERALSGSNLAIPSPAPIVEQAPEPKPAVPPVPAPVIAEDDVAELEKQAMSELAIDKDLAKIPGGMIEVMSMVDNDKGLSRIAKIDPRLAFREAKSMYLQSLGISAPVLTPKPSSAPGGVPVGSADLTALTNALDNAKPGTKEYWDLAKKLDEALEKRNNR